MYKRQAWETCKVSTKKLKVTKDFDAVVLGVSIGALPSVAGELIEREPKWRAMVRHVKAVPTQAFQVWMNRDVHQLGWPRAGVNLSGYVEPFDTWADMSHLIQEEEWDEPVRSIAYFCSVLSDAVPPSGEVTKEFYQQQRLKVRDNAIGYLKNDARALWPKAIKPNGKFRWKLLNTGSAHRDLSGAERFDSQFWTANVNPSDLYVQSVPGSCIYRVSPLDMSFDNLTIAGDWTKSGLDSGCIESAVMSGLLAAHALSGSPSLQNIVGYDHP